MEIKPKVFVIDCSPKELTTLAEGLFRYLKEQAAYYSTMNDFLNKHSKDDEMLRKMAETLESDHYTKFCDYLNNL